jgi:hypothetical protein
MRIDVLYFEGCPNHEPTLALVQEVVTALGVDATIEVTEINDPDQVERHRFLGSPTVRVEGEDIETNRRDDTQFAMGCRRYGTHGVPARALLETAIRFRARR